MHDKDIVDVKARTVRLWSVVHTWTSLTATAFLLLLCITGLPLIFHHEIDDMLGYAPRPETAIAGARRATIDDIARAALAHAPGKVLQYVAWDKDQPGAVVAYTNHAVDSAPDDAVLTAFDATSAKSLGPVGTGPMLIVLKLHTDMFAGKPGKLFLGSMGLLMIAAIMSGIVLYWPFTRRQRFGNIRSRASRRVGWLDMHNLIGIITIAWVTVVSGTGVINTWAEPMLDAWKAGELASMVAPYAGKPPPSRLASLDKVAGNAMRAAPGMEPAFIAFPGTPFSSSHHFAVFMRGNEPLTSRLLKPVLLDGETAAIADTRDLPLYLKALFVSQPLHFGDYGGHPLKIIWTLLDVLTILVLGSGLYLWLVRRRKAKRGSDLLTARSSLRLATKVFSSEACPRVFFGASTRRVGTGSREENTSNQKNKPGWRAVFGAPLSIGLLSLTGLIAALLDRGIGHVMAWIGVGLPILIVAWFWMRRAR
jgi:uncharacterized iron-regulated membrane protein